MGQSLEIAQESNNAILTEASTVARATVPDIPITSVAIDGFPTQALIERGDDAQMIVVGRRGRGGFGRLMLGSTSARLAHHARVPVVVVPEGTWHPSISDSTIVVGLDSSPHAQRALEFALEEAERRGSRVVAVRAWWNALGDAPAIHARDLEDASGIVGEQERVLSEALAGWQEKFPGIHIVRAVENEHPAKALIGHSAAADLVVVGAQGERGVYNFVIGSITDALLRHAQCPVVVAR
jgi:nucleotide-binding universal stress UspA family protein